jgi:hypothetical protein
MRGARKALLAMEKRDGFITPRTVLAEARDRKAEFHPDLHRHFTWDDGKAGERWRLEEAQRLIQRYTITVDSLPDRKVKLRVFSSVDCEDGPAYFNTGEAMKDPEMRDFIMQQAMKDIAALRMKYQALVDFDEALQASIGKSGRRKAS